VRLALAAFAALFRTAIILRLCDIDAAAFQRLNHIARVLEVLLCYDVVDIWDHRQRFELISAGSKGLRRPKGYAPDRMF
jgi:hypothetical protein